jgi:Tfp pilus assembly protein PilF
MSITRPLPLSLARALVGAAALALAGCATAGPGELARSAAERLRSPISGQSERSAGRTAAQQAEPPDARQMLAQGDGARSAGQRASAAWKYLRALELDPEDPTPRERLAMMHLEHDPARAAAIFRTLLAQDDEYAPARLGLGLALLHGGDAAGARVELERAVALDPENAQTLAALGIACDGLADHAAAQHYFRLAHEQQPDDWRVLNNLGFSLTLSGEYEAAVEALRAALRLEPGDPGLWNNMGFALGRLARYDEALDAFRRGGDETAARNNVGYLMDLNGERDRARASYEAALAAGGGNERLTVIQNVRRSESGLAGGSAR